MRTEFLCLIAKKICVISLYGLVISSSWDDDGSDTDLGDVVYKEAEIVDMTAFDGNCENGEIDAEIEMVGLKSLKIIILPILK